MVLAMADTAMARGLLMLSPQLMLRLSLLLRLMLMLTMAMVDMAMAMEDTALATTARGQLMPTTATAVMVDMAAMVATDMARGLLMPRLTMVVDSSVRPVHMVDLPTLLASAPLMLMPTMAMVDMEAMEATAAERGQLMPMPTTATEDMEAMADMVVTVTERGLPMLMPTTAMVDMVVMATAVAMDTARGLLMPAMVVMAMADMAMASKSYLVNGLTSLLLTFHDTHRNQTQIISPLSIMAGTRII